MFHPGVPVRLLAIRLLAILLLASMAHAADPPAPVASPAEAPAPPDSQPAPWTARAGDAPQPAGGADRQTTPLRLRVYESSNALGPAHGHAAGQRPGGGGGHADEDGYAVDVTARMVACGDGSTAIAGLDIGGWAYALDYSCPDHGDTEPAPSQTPPINPPAEPAGASAGPIQCNAATWNCRTAARP